MLVSLSLFTWTASAETLKVSTKSFAPFSSQQGTEWVGFSLDIWAEIAKRLNVDYTVVGTDSVSALLKRVEDQKADVAVAGITITAERERVVDFSHPFYESGLQIMTLSHGNEASFISVMISSGLLEVLAILILAMLLMGHLIWLVERRRNTGEFSPNYPRGIWDGFWWAAVTVTTVGYGDKVPKGDFGRVLGLFWMFTGLILISFFTASVTTALTLEKLEGEIAGPEDLRGKDVACPRGSTSAAYVQRTSAKLVECDVVTDCFELLADKSVDAVVYDAPVLQYHASHEGSGDMAVVGPVFQRESYGIALQEGSPYREKINTILLELRETGVYADIHLRWFGVAE